jgi:hypothetical protein
MNRARIAVIVAVAVSILVVVASLRIAGPPVTEKEQIEFTLTEPGEFTVTIAYAVQSVEVAGSTDLEQIEDKLRATGYEVEIRDDYDWFYPGSQFGVIVKSASFQLELESDVTNVDVGYRKKNNTSEIHARISADTNTANVMERLFQYTRLTEEEFLHQAIVNADDKTVDIYFAGEPRWDILQKDMGKLLEERRYINTFIEEYENGEIESFVPFAFISFKGTVHQDSDIDLGATLVIDEKGYGSFEVYAEDRLTSPNVVFKDLFRRLGLPDKLLDELNFNQVAVGGPA